jgi:opacity protein-like surface antigen
LIFNLPINAGLCTSIDEIIEAKDENSFEEVASKERNKMSYFAIQIGVYLDQTDADKKVINLKSQGFEPYIFQSINSRGQTVYAARIGKFDDYETANNEILKLEKNFNIAAIITYYDSLNPVDQSQLLSSPAASALFEPSPSPDTREDSPLDQNDRTDTYTPTYEPTSFRALQEKINSLELEINKLKDEAEVRRQLTITEDEAKADEEDILDAAGRQYTLTEAGNIKFRIGVGYSYSDYDAIKQSTRVEIVANHTLRANFNVSYGLKDNITLGVGIPFVYKYHKVGTIDSKEVNDLGDLNLSWQFQPVKTGGDLPTIIVNGAFKIPVGRSPYEIDPGEELSTSSGIYSTTIGVSVSQVSDPVVVFSSFGLTYSLPVTDINQKRNEGTLDEVDPGISMGVGVGMGYALSYKLNLNLSFGYSYAFETTYKYQDAPDARSGVGVGSDLSLGVGYKVSQNQNLNFTLGIPITDSRSFSFSCSTPIEFEL